MGEMQRGGVLASQLTLTPYVLRRIAIRLLSCAPVCLFEDACR